MGHDDIDHMPATRENPQLLGRMEATQVRGLMLKCYTEETTLVNDSIER